MSSRVAEWGGLQTRLRLETRNSGYRIEDYFCSLRDIQGRRSRLRSLQASLPATSKCERAGADNNSGRLGRIRAVTNPSRPQCGSSDDEHSSKNVGNDRVNDNSDAGFETQIAA